MKKKRERQRKKNLQSKKFTKGVDKTPFLCYTMCIR